MPNPAIRATACLASTPWVVLAIASLGPAVHLPELAIGGAPSLLSIAEIA